MDDQGDPAPDKLAALSLADSPAAAMVPGGSRDHLSPLPDHLLISILARLRTREAAQMSALSRRWGGVWAQSPFLEFEVVKPSVPAEALDVYRARGDLDIHSITVYSNPKDMDAESTAAWLTRAAPILSGGLHFLNSRTVTPEARRDFLQEDEEAAVRPDEVELPCFNRATGIWMDLGFLGLALPPAGVFYALRVLRLDCFWSRDHFRISDAMLPSLHYLTIYMVRGLRELALTSNSLLIIHLSALPELYQLDIVAPRLLDLVVMECFYYYGEPEPVASIAAERLRLLQWNVPCLPETDYLREMRDLRVLAAPPISTHWSEDICADYLDCFRAAHYLELKITLGPWSNEWPLLMEGITIPFVEVLWLYLDTNDHDFEGRILTLLTRSSGITELKLSFLIRNEVEEFCSLDCICHNEPAIAGANIAPVRALRRVDITNFNGAPREVHFVEQLVLRAPMLEVLRIVMVGDHTLGGIASSCPRGCIIHIEEYFTGNEEE